MSTSQIAKLHCITLDQSQWTHEEQVQQLCDAGAEWVQLRIKCPDMDDKVRTALEARRLTARAGVTLIINDDVELARMVQADGVHLGLSDMPVAQARKILGHNAIIGGTANTLEQLQQRVNEGVNYIGLGPFTHTQTKNNLAPVLGLQGYLTLSEFFPNTPIIAIGGILPTDVPQIMQTGVYGIAVSSGICAQNDIALALKQYTRTL
jgi:thiamine-phosphate pyrophosphorylase